MKYKTLMLMLTLLLFSGSMMPTIVAARTPSAVSICEQLWLARNKLFARNGQCFTSERAIAALGKGCFPPYGRLSQNDERQVNAILEMERLNHCNARQITRAAQEGKIDIPIVLGGSVEFDACSATGEVVGLNPRGDGFLAVRSGPGGKPFKELDRIHNGKLVYICAESGPWYGVVYAPPGTDESYCNVSTPWTTRQPYTGPCSYGWVHSRYIRLLAG